VKPALRVLIVSVVLSAGFGVYALVAGDFGRTQGRILLSSLTVSAVSILSMACGVAWERRRLGAVPALGVLVAIAAGALLLLGIWGEGRGSVFWKTTACVAIGAVAAAHASLMSLASLDARFAWAKPAAYALAVALAGALMTAICAEADDEQVWRGIGVLSVLLSAMTITVPVLHRMSARAEETLFCPGCAAPLKVAGEPCGRCGARYSIEKLE